MISESVGQAAPTRYLDALYANPAITACGLLSSQLFEKANRLLENGAPVERPFVVATEYGGQNRIAERSSFLGRTAADNQLLFVDLAGDSEKRQTGLYAKYRSDVLIEVARFALIGSGPCNYVQFAGELDDAGIVATPMDEKRRQPLLEQILLLKPGHRFVGRPPEAKSHQVPELNAGLNDALSEYIFCDTDQLPQAAEALKAIIHQKTFHLGLITAVDAAYASIVDRFDNSPLETYMQNNASAHVRQAYQQALMMLHEDALSRPEIELLGLPTESIIGQKIRQALASDKERLETTPTKDLDDFVFARFKSVFNVDFSPQYEQAIENIFRFSDVVLEMVVRGGYKAGNKSADVKYSLDIHTLDNPNQKYLDLYASVVSMIDAEPWLCASFVVDKLGALRRVKANGDLTELSANELSELNEIVSFGALAARPNEGSVTKTESSEAKKHWWRKRR